MNTLLIAKKIRRARQELGLSQKSVAQTIGICRHSYIDLEKGRVFPKYDRMVELAKILKLKLPVAYGG